jgi:nucleoside-diphosphate-sugar epimerase
MSNQLHIIFGTGPLGLAVAKELTKRGQTFKMVNRSGKRPVELPASVEIIASDVYDAAKVRAVTQGAAVVYLCAQPEYTEWPEKWPPLMRAFIEGMSGSAAKIVMGDNLYMYGDTDGQPVHEDLPTAAHTRKGKVRAEVAEMLLAAHRAGKVRATIGRASDFYGPGVRDSLVGDMALAPALQGKAAQLVGNLDLPHTLTYIEDFGRALVILGAHEAALGRAWIVPSPETLTQRQWMTLVFKELGYAPKMTGLNKMMMTLGGLFIPAAREGVEMMYEFDKPFIADHRQFMQAFGQDFGEPTPHAEAIKRTVAWYKANAANGKH